MGSVTPSTTSGADTTSSTRATCLSARPTQTTSTTTKSGGSTENTTTTTARRRRTDSTWETWTTPGVTPKSSLFPHTSAAAADSHTHTINPAIDPSNCHIIPCQSSIHFTITNGLQCVLHNV